MERKNIRINSVEWDKENKRLRKTIHSYFMKIDHENTKGWNFLFNFSSGTIIISALVMGLGGKYTEYGILSLILSFLLTLIIGMMHGLKVRGYMILEIQREIIEDQSKKIFKLFREDILISGISPSLLSDITIHIDTIRKAVKLFDTEVREKSLFLKKSRKIFSRNEKYFKLLEDDQKWLYEYAQSFLSDLKVWLGNHQNELLVLKDEVEKVSQDADVLGSMVLMQSSKTLDSQIADVEKVRARI